MKVSSCIRSMRLRTLPLSLSGTVMGVCIAYTITDSPAPGTWLIALTTALLQILSNLSNELGDTLSGTDTAERQGMHYSLQDGGMSIGEMKGLIAGIAACCCASGLGMVWTAFGTILAPAPLALLLLGAAATDAATRVTVAILLGERRARIYQTVLLALGWGLMCVFSLVNASGASAWRWIYLVTLPLYVLHLKGVWTHSGRALDHLLPMLVISTFALSVLAGLGIML